MVVIVFLRKTVLIAVYDPHFSKRKI